MNGVVEQEVEDLRSDYTVDVEEDADQNPEKFTHVIVRDWPIPSDEYNKDMTDVMIRVPDGYPNKPPDWIHVDEDLTLSNGEQLRNAKPNRIPNWLSLSYHPKQVKDDFEWQPYEHDLRWYLEVIVAMRFRQED